MEPARCSELAATVRTALAPAFLSLWVSGLQAQIPVIPAVPVEQTRVAVFATGEGAGEREHAEPLANFRLRMEFRLPGPDSGLSLRLHPRKALEFAGVQAKGWQTLDVQYEQLPGKAASFTAVLEGRSLATNETIPGTGEVAGALAGVRLDGDFTVAVRFAAQGDGSLLSKCRLEKWEPGAKMLGLRGGRLFYDIGWLGVLTGKTPGLTDGRAHTAVLRAEAGRVTLFADGRMEGMREGHTRPDPEGLALHAGLGAKGFVGDLQRGTVEQIRFWSSALGMEEARKLSTGKAEIARAVSAEWNAPPAVATFPKGIPGVPTRIAVSVRGGAEFRNAWVQPLAAEDHAGMVARWSEESLAEGGQIYHQLCVTCHGSLTQEGSMPTSRHFQREPFKNGSDPFRIFQTLTQGYGLMMPLPQYTPEQKYALIHYLRETFLAPHNRSELFPINDAYLASLPLRMRTLARKDTRKDDAQQYEKMNFGPMLEWTYQVAPDNFAYKGIAVRLDPGEGGVSQGRAWIVYDHDTQRVAAATTGSFIDWKGVAFDGSHNSHCSLTGTPVFTTPAGPGWANPADGSWDDPRFRGRDGKPYGPLPRSWACYRGAYLHGATLVQSYAIGDAGVLESAEIVDYGKTPVFIRTLNVGKSSRDLKLRLAMADGALLLRILGMDSLKPRLEAGCQVLPIPAAATPAKFRVALGSGIDEASLAALAGKAQLPLDLASLTKGGPPRWTTAVTTQGIQGKDDGPFATDVLTHPESGENPWQSWMRLTGLDFFADGKRAAVCTWMGDVWTVEGISRQPVGELRWRRMATGLFQPLGLKIVQETIHVACRDQIARLHDLNGDGETDYVECFNNDHQVTEHFHEFAMGLQADAEGNFYYAKSARHALPALVAHHGTLLRVSAGGTRTDVLASGFRAANGVCLNPDGSFFVTDQEGHWMPKNRINLVRGKGPGEFFGNMLGYHEVTDASDAAMLPPLCWITNVFDRSPAELLWVPRDARWGPLNGALLNLSYGYGKVYTVPFEQVGEVCQGGMCALPMPQFPTGVMRGRFHPQDGQLYACGMFAWAGNQMQPGGLYRVRYTGQPAWQPLEVSFRKGEIRVRFSDALEPAAADPARYSAKAWSLHRTASYGSPHVNEHGLLVTGAELAGPATLRLLVPDLQPTACLEIACRLPSRGGGDTERVIHGTVHVLPP